jgi:hypothetical protein
LSQRHPIKPVPYFFRELKKSDGRTAREFIVERLKLTMELIRNHVGTLEKKLEEARKRSLW